MRTTKTRWLGGRKRAEEHDVLRKWRFPRRQWRSSGDVSEQPGGFLWGKREAMGRGLKGLECAVIRGFNRPESITLKQPLSGEVMGVIWGRRRTTLTWASVLTSGAGLSASGTGMRAAGRCWVGWFGLARFSFFELFSFFYFLKPL